MAECMNFAGVTVTIVHRTGELQLWKMDEKLGQEGLGLTAKSLASAYPLRAHSACPGPVA